MEKKIKLFGRKKLILSLYDKLTEKEHELNKKIDEAKILKKENNQLNTELIALKNNNKIASDYDLNNFLERTMANHNSFLDHYRRIFSNFDLLSTKEYKTFVEVLMFDKDDIYPRRLKNALKKEFIRQAINYYEQNFFTLPIYFDQKEILKLEKQQGNFLTIDAFDIKKIIKLNSKSNILEKNIEDFNIHYNKTINYINNIQNITDQEIVVFKEKIISLVAELIIFLLFEFNSSIDDYYPTMNDFLYDLDYKGFLEWKNTTSNQYTAKTFQKTLIKSHWLSFNRKNNICDYNFHISYPNDYWTYMANFGKPNTYDSKHTTKLDVLVKGSKDIKPFAKTNDYYGWLLNDKKETSWNDKVYLSKEDINAILNNEHACIIKVYGLDYNLTDSLGNDVVDIIQEKRVDLKILKLDNQYLIDKLFFYFIYIKRHI